MIFNDLNIILGNLSASKTLKELLSRLEFPLLKSSTLAITPIFVILSSSILIKPEMFVFSADHLCKK